MRFDDSSAVFRIARRASGGRRLSGDRGYVMAMTAMLIVPLLISTAFAVDTGSWYAQSSRMQRAADAASLAGVVWMPDGGTASTIATEVMRQNGFSAPEFNVTAVGVGENQLRVSVSGPGQLFFGRVVLKNKSLSRSSTAEYVLPVPMGSPKNFLGTGSLLGAADPDRENMWLAESGRCASKEQGDRMNTETDANWTGAGGSYAGCRGGSTVLNSENDVNGYIYVMDLAANHTGPVYLEVYDPAICKNVTVGEDYDTYGGDPFSFKYQVRDRDNTPFNVFDNTVLRTTTTSISDCSGGSSSVNRWKTMHVFTNPVAGQYFLQITDDTNASTTTNRNTNQFAIRARFDGTPTVAGGLQANSVFWSRCTTIIDTPPLPDFKASCPQIHGLSSMSIYLKDSAAAADFYLADVSDKYSGKTMHVTLWDAGEGAASIELLNPLGAAVTFNWVVEEPCTTGIAPAGGCSGTGVSILDVSGTGAQPGTRRLSTSKYNDRAVTLTVPLPADIDTAYLGKTWWKVRYVAGAGGVTDRTTWTMNITGDPVHLVK